MENLEATLKAQIIEQLNLEELDLQDFGNDTPLFGDDGIGLDSIDALELIVLMEKDYNLKIANPEDGSKIFKNVNTMAEFIRANQ